MGYDVSFHPISSEEMQEWYFTPLSWVQQGQEEKVLALAAQEHIAAFKDGKCPVQLMVMKCDKFKGKGFDAFLMSQMWDCQEDRERIFRECKYQVVATDMLAAALPALERANLDADFLEALEELYPTCEAFYF